MADRYLTQLEQATSLSGALFYGEQDNLPKKFPAVLFTSGGSAWGSITGTLSNQTDLQSALDTKQPLATVLTNTTAAFTTEQQTKLSNIESAADVTDEANVVTALDGATLTAVTVAGTDKVLVQDASDSSNLKTVTAQSIADLGGGGGGSTTNNYSSIAAPQLFNPDASGVSGDMDDFTLSSSNAVAFVTLNGQVLDDSEYSLASTTLTVTPDNGFDATSDEVLVFQHSFATSANGFVAGYVAKTASYTLLQTDYTVEVTANSVTLTLPTAVGKAGQIYNLKNSGTGIVTMNTTSSQTIDGSVSGVLTLAQYENLTVQSNGTNWIILGSV